MNRLITRRWISTTAAAVVAVTGLSACGGGDSAGQDYGLTRPGTITAAITAGDYPFVSPDETGKPVGMLVDLNNLIASRMHLNIVYKTTTIEAGLPGLTSGQYDMMSVGLVQTPERKRSVAFTRPIFWGQNVLVVPAGSTAKKLSDFTGKRVGAGSNSQQEDFVKKNLKNAHRIAEPTDSTAVNQLLSGNVDAACLGSTHVPKVLQEHPGKLRIAVTSPQDQPGAMAVNKKLPKFLTAYNKQLTALANDGTFLKLYKKYFPHLPYPKQMYKYWPAIEKQVKQQKGA